MRNPTDNIRVREHWNNGKIDAVVLFIEVGNARQIGGPIRMSYFLKSSFVITGTEIYSVLSYKIHRWLL